MKVSLGLALFRIQDTFSSKSLYEFVPPLLLRTKNTQTPRQQDIHHLPYPPVLTA